MDVADHISPPSPSLLRYTFGFLAVGLAWGFTTPFMRRAALTAPPPRAAQPNSSASWVARQALGVWHAVADLLSRPSYAVPLLINLSGSAVFFLIVGQAELSLTVPITNSLAFLFTVLGEYFAEGKIITGDTWLGMFLVLAGIGLCVHAKSGV